MTLILYQELLEAHLQAISLHFQTLCLRSKLLLDLHELPFLLVHELDLFFLEVSDRLVFVPENILNLV